ncbi:MAG: glycoside hydrolase family 2 TIM barrel-domain containing protein [Bacillota bacterium]
MRLRSFAFFVVICLTVASQLAGQIRINSLPRYELVSQDSAFFGVTRTRGAISLNGGWNVYRKDARDEMTAVGVPCNFTGEVELTFEKELKLSSEQITNNSFQLVFLGLSYSAEIIVNNSVIYKHPGGDFPFHVDLPRDILKTNRKNILAVKVFHDLHSNNTVPLNQRYLFPESNGGIFRDVYIQVMPSTYISNLDFTYRSVGGNHFNLFLSSKIESHLSDGRLQDSSRTNQYTLRTRILSASGQELMNSAGEFDLPSHKDKLFSQSYDIFGPVLWSPQAPYTYSLRVQLFRGEQLIDEIIKPVSFFSLEVSREALSLNGIAPFTLNGTTYYGSNYSYGNMLSYNRMREDIKIIKSMGFNAVRFAKDAPHPYLLKLCEQYGLLAFIELPVNSVPQEIAAKGSFKDVLKSYLGQFLNSYKEYSAVSAIGLGSSYLPNSADHTTLIANLADLSKRIIRRITYASFVGFNVPEIDKVDLYGVEFLNKPMEEYSGRYENLANQLGKGRVFISEATYATFLGSTNGYSNPFSYEAQAKFFADLIDYTHKNQTPGFFINSVFDYRGNYTSFSAGYSPENIYLIGILGENRQTDRLSQKVIYSKLNDGEDVTIPIGSKRDDAPVVFIIYGLGLALLMGALVNSRKKFREDATRALLRPYNFYADIRDLRVMSGLHTTILMIVLALCSALLQVNLLYFFRANVLLEKVILAFGNPSWVKFISYLAWNPAMALVWTTLLSIAFFIATSIIVKLASFFIRNRVFFTSVYFTVIWSFLPLVLLMPLGLVLYKILNANVLTFYLFLALIIFTVWIFYRLMKGIYVIFDVNPAPVYFYSLALMAVVLGGVLIYFQLTESTVYYLLNAISQYKLM